MGLTVNLMVIYFCILFTLYLSDPNMTTGFIEFTSGTYEIGWDTLITGVLSSLAGWIIATTTRDAMTGIISAFAIAMVSWIIIPTNFLVGAPWEIRVFIVGLMNLLWGLAIISFIRGYEA